MHRRQDLRGPTEQPPRDSPQLQRVSLQLADRQVLQVSRDRLPDEGEETLSHIAWL